MNIEFSVKTTGNDRDNMLSLILKQNEYEKLAVEYFGNNNSKADFYLRMAQLYMDKINAFVFMHNTQMPGKELLIVD